MKDEELVNLVLEKTKETVGLSKTPKISDSFVNDLLMDSLDTIEYIMMVEEEFDIIIKDEEAEKIDTIADLIKIIKEKQK